MVFEKAPKLWVVCLSSYPVPIFKKNKILNDLPVKERKKKGTGKKCDIHFKIQVQDRAERTEWHDMENKKNEHMFFLCKNVENSKNSIIGCLDFGLYKNGVFWFLLIVHRFHYLVQWATILLLFWIFWYAVPTWYQHVDFARVPRNSNLD